MAMERLVSMAFLEDLRYPGACRMLPKLFLMTRRF